jgi:hypothetical protein
MRECTNDTNPEKQDFHLRTLSFVKQTSPLGTMYRVAEHAFPGSKRKYRQKTLYIEKIASQFQKRVPKKELKYKNTAQIQHTLTFVKQSTPVRHHSRSQKEKSITDDKASKKRIAVYLS